MAGGIGIAPFLYLVKSIPNPVEVFVGYRSNPYFIEELKPYAEKIHIATEDGSVGEKGFVTSMLSPEDFDMILACGPNPMMETLQNMIGKVPSQFSMESRMACGIGACLGCSIETTEGMKRVCHEGPVFVGQEVIFHA